VNGREWIDLIAIYYAALELKEPDADESLDWLLTELAEAKELLLARRGGWVRNHPADHPQFSSARFAEELGDIIMMALRAGMAETVDPLAALYTKIDNRLR
jgi:hypothetical protein